MAVGHEDMGRARRRLGLAALGEDRVADKPGIDEQDRLFDLDAKAGMAKPGDLHLLLRNAAALAGRTWRG